MHSSLRILQITLIITQITTVKASVSTSEPPKSSVNASTFLSTSIVSFSSLMQDHGVSPMTSSSSMQKRATMTSVHVTLSTAEQSTSTSSENRVTARSLQTPKMSTVYSSSARQTESSMIKVPVTSTTELSTRASDVSSSSNVTVGAPAPTTSKLLTTTSLEGRVSENTTKPGSQTISVPNTTSTELATKTSNTFSVASTKATTLSPSGLLTGQTQSITANYSLSLASQRGSNSAESEQTLTTSLPVSVNWTDWSVDSSACEAYCSEKGGTVTASRQCYSQAKTLIDNVCTKHDNLTKVVTCAEHCPISGKETFGSSISTLAVSILIVINLKKCIHRGANIPQGQQHISSAQQSPSPVRRRQYLDG